MTTRWHDEGRELHLLKDDGSPACGARFYASAGMALPGDNGPRCRRCDKLPKVSEVLATLQMVLARLDSTPETTAEWNVIANALRKASADAAKIGRRHV